jgi:hypothetical protein
MTPDAPYINGNYFSWASIEIKVDGNRYLGFKGVTYSQEQDRGAVYGTHSQKLGRTRGQNKPEGSMEMFKEAFDDLVEKFGDGFMEKVFDVVVSYQENGPHQDRHPQGLHHQEARGQPQRGHRRPHGQGRPGRDVDPLQRQEAAQEHAERPELAVGP